MTSHFSRRRWVAVLATCALAATGSLIAAQPAIAAYTGQSTTPVVATVLGTQPELPDTVDVTNDSGDVESLPVQWQQVDPASLSTPYTRTIVSGTASGDAGQVTVTAKVWAVPDNLVYLIDSGRSGGASEIVDAVKDLRGDALLNDVPDRKAATADQTWGYIERNPTTPQRVTVTPGSADDWATSYLMDDNDSDEGLSYLLGLDRGRFRVSAAHVPRRTQTHASWVNVRGDQEDRREVAVTQSADGLRPPVWVSHDVSLMEPGSITYETQKVQTTGGYNASVSLIAVESLPGDPTIPTIPASTATKVVSDTYPTKSQGTNWWRSSMITGNGSNGALIAGNPTEDTQIYQNMAFNMPNDDLRETPVISGYLDGVRRSLVNGTAPAGDPAWSLQYDYTYHPGHQLELKTPPTGPVREDYRWTDYETGEVGVNYTDDRGEWERRTFASRADDVVVTHLSSSSTGAPVDLDLAITPPDEMAVESGSIASGLRYKQLAAQDGSWIGQVGHYPSYAVSELKDGGFAGVTYVVTKGGTKSRYVVDKPLGTRAAAGSQRYGVSVRGAEEVFLITASDRDVKMGLLADFAAQQDYAVVDRLIERVEGVGSAAQYRPQGELDYDAMVTPHAAIHGAEFRAVSLDLPGAEATEAFTNERLLRTQRTNAETLEPAMVERAFAAGRYATISSSGFSTPRLGGMWTGAWNSQWQADWTTDANVNLQIAGANIGALPSEIEGYANFLLRIVPDWEKNAENIFGMEDAIFAPPRTDGDRSSVNHFSGNGGNYPFQYWNAGASWLIEPLYEYWTTNGNVDIEIPEDVDLQKLASVLSPTAEDLSDAQIAALEQRGSLRLVEDLLLPLLIKQSNFWQQFVSPEYFEDASGAARYVAGKTSLADGERYLLLPCYSPENKPSGGNSPITINCAMDIAAARDGLRMTTEIAKAANGGTGVADPAWLELIDQLPTVKYDTNGALKEWALKRYTEQHAHRHVSQAYFAWPAHEAQTSEELRRGLAKTLELRKATAGDKVSGHGWLHIGLVDARLKNEVGTTEALRALLTKQAYYSSFTTNHNITGDSAYASDILNTVPTLLMESIVYSDRGRVEILPALPSDMPQGRLTGSLARTQAELTDVSWDLPANSASVTVTSRVAQTIDVSSGVEWATATVKGKTIRNSGQPLRIAFAEGESTTVAFTLGAPTAAPTFESSAAPRCVAGSVQLVVSVRNTSGAPMGLAISSSYGSKNVASLAAGSKTSVALPTRQETMPEGSVSVATTVDGITDERQVAYPTLRCTR